MSAAFDEIWLGQDRAAGALGRVRARMQGKLGRWLEETRRREANP